MLSAAQSIARMQQIAAPGMKMGLERTKALLSALGDPQEKLRVIHVAGTNGKGSFSAMLSSVLTAQGFKTGSFNSPAMLELSDQFGINCKSVPEPALAEAINAVCDAAEALSDTPTEFEMITAAAFRLFFRESCDICVMECGMGGDTDSTNVISSPLLSVITNVAVDHAAFLGSTTAEIASHKAGIIKQGRPVYFGGNDPQALKVISERADALSAKLYLPERESVRFLDSNSCTEFVYKHRKLSCPLRGVYQQDNIINVLSCIDILRSLGIKITSEAVKQGLSEVRWPGRFETLSSEPKMIFDGAHNPDGMQSLCESIKLYYPDRKPVLLIGVLADKDYRLYADMLKPLVRCAFAVTPGVQRALPAEDLSRCFNENGIMTKPCESIASGFEAACACAEENAAPLITAGSLYMYKDIYDAVKAHKSK